MHAPVRLAAPAALPVSVAQARAQLRVDFDEDDTLIEGLIGAATDALDGYTGILGRALVTQTWRQDFDRFTGCMRLPLAPVASISEIVYFDAENAEQTLSTDVYELLSDARGPYVALQADQAWPASYARAGAVRVSYVAGEAVEDLKPALRAAIMLHVAHLYENRAAGSATPISVLPLAYYALIAPYRRTSL